MSADELLASLEEQESQGATEELLQIPGFLERLAIAEQETREGRLTSVERLRRDDGMGASGESIKLGTGFRR